MLYLKVPFVPGNFKLPTVSVANTPSSLGSRKASKNAGRQASNSASTEITNYFHEKVEKRQNSI